MKARSMQIDNSRREGWEAAFRRMTERGDDVLEEKAPSLTAFDEAEWAWRFDCDEPSAAGRESAVTRVKPHP